MESSDDEPEIVPRSVSNYFFVDQTESPINFAVLPIQFNDSKKSNDGNMRIFLHGDADEGLQKIYKPVIAWKLELQGDQPEVFVLVKGKQWVKLLKHRKSYEENIRTTLIAVQLLHYLKKNPEASEKDLWDHLRKVFNTFDIGPSEDDLWDHHQLIKQFMERDETLGKCQLLPICLVDKPRKRTPLAEDAKKNIEVKSFIVGDDELDYEDETDDEADLFDSVCAICDNGGELLCCEGRCMRSFHATRSAGAESHCRSLGYSRAEVEAIQIFLCKNCEYNQHQCFACGKLDPSDKLAGAEVFKCVNATCGHFYHPKCIAKLLFSENETEASELEKKILAGESFMCPIHKCCVCRQGENKEDESLQFGMCRRCPTSYHRKCLPSDIAFEDSDAEDLIPRAWDGLLPNRILIYCKKHEIEEELGTPIRNHIIFPELPEKKKVIDVQKSKTKVLVKKKAGPANLPRDKAPIKPAKVAAVPPTEGEKLSLGKTGGSITEEHVDNQKKAEPLKIGTQFVAKKSVVAPKTEVKISSKDKPKSLLSVIPPASIEKKFMSSFPLIDQETEKSASTLIEKVSASLTLESIIRKRAMPSTHAYSARHVDKSITHGKVEGSVEAIKTALQRVENGGSIDDAKAVCEPEVVKQINKWGNKLKVYLSPFLHSMCYTSFGRHFTKVDKLREIVDMLHCYIQNGDMIVDFCCGANDFSQLMREKLDAVGKKCSFKNYDVIRPKNDFCFGKRDWMKVQQNELPTGSQLVMGLNPPFGVKAGLANKFIDKALSFKPKLLVLIVPKETERLDEKKTPYDLVWEDGEKFSGKAFYLPGSFDVNDKQIEQWNIKPPVLYLWSRSDWTAKHKAIAAKHGHPFTRQQEVSAVVNENERFSNATRDIEEQNEVKREGNRESDHSSKRKSQDENESRREDSKSAQHINKKISLDENKSRKDGIEEQNEVKREGNRESDHSSKRKSQDENESRREDSKSAQHSNKKISLDENKSRKDGIDEQNEVKREGNRESDHSSKRKSQDENESRREGSKSAQHSNKKMSLDENKWRKDGNKNAEHSNKRKSLGENASKRESSKSAERSNKERFLKEKEVKGEDSITVSHSNKSHRVKRKSSQKPNNRPPKRNKSQNIGAESFERSVVDESSYMNISPLHKAESRCQVEEHGASEALETSSAWLIAHRSFSGSIQEHGAACASGQNNAAFNEEIDEIARRYAANGSSLSQSGGRLGNVDYGTRNSDDRFLSYNRGSSRIDAYPRESSINNFDGFGRSQEADLLPQPRYDNLTPVNRYSLGGSGSMLNPYLPSNYGLTNAAVASSAMQRYASRLNETNYTAPSSLPGGAPLQGRYGYLDLPGIQRDMRRNQLGFAPTPQPPYPHHPSSGWLDD